MNIFFLRKTGFFDHRNLPDQPGPEKIKSKKIQKFWPDELPARQPDRHRARVAGDPAPGYSRDVLPARRPLPLPPRGSLQRPGRAGPGIDEVSLEEVSSEEVSGVLEAQVPSVPRSHRSQGPIGPPKVSMDPPQGSLGTHIWISIYGYGYPYMDMDIHTWISLYGYPKNT